MQASPTCLLLILVFLLFGFLVIVAGTDRGVGVLVIFVLVGDVYDGLVRVDADRTGNLPLTLSKASAL